MLEGNRQLEGNRSLRSGPKCKQKYGGAPLGTHDLTSIWSTPNPLFVHDVERLPLPRSVPCALRSMPRPRPLVPAPSAPRTRPPPPPVQC